MMAVKSSIYSELRPLSLFGVDSSGSLRRHNRTGRETETETEDHVRHWMHWWALCNKLPSIRKLVPKNGSGRDLGKRNTVIRLIACAQPCGPVFSDLVTPAAKGPPEILGHFRPESRENNLFIAWEKAALHFLFV